MKEHKFDLDAYPFSVRPLPADEGGGYLVEYPDVPYCIADGKTAEEAIRRGHTALTACLETIAEAGKSIPRPGTATKAPARTLG